MALQPRVQRRRQPTRWPGQSHLVRQCQRRLFGRTERPVFVIGQGIQRRFAQARRQGLDPVALVAEGATVQVGQPQAYQLQHPAIQPAGTQTRSPSQAPARSSTLGSRSACATT